MILHQVGRFLGGLSPFDRKRRLLSAHISPNYRLQRYIFISNVPKKTLIM